jgi:GT2 family glycosyltransferase
MKVAAVIPTRDRCSVLLATLHSLADQVTGRHELEIVVVDNGSRDATRQAVRDVAPALDVPLTLIEAAEPGVSAARNAGVRATEAELILSLNDDTRAAGADLVRGHADAHERAEGPVGIVGRIDYAPELTLTPFMSWLNSGAQFAFDRLGEGDLPDGGYLYTAHASVPRAVWLESGGMDERLRFGYEDGEFGRRLAGRGVRLCYRPDLRTFHHHAVRLAQWRERQRVMGRAGATANALSAGRPGLAPPPRGGRWWVKRGATRVLEHVPTEWAWLPDPARRLVYGALHGGWYARGYDEADTSS